MKYLGVDYGKRNIGLALSEGLTASSWKVVNVHGLDDARQKIKAIVVAEGIDKVVVGVPESGESRRLAGNFIRSLVEAGISVAEADETLSSHDAKIAMRNMGVSRKALDDAYAAKMILQNFLDGNSSV